MLSFVLPRLTPDLVLRAYNRVNGQEYARAAALLKARNEIQAFVSWQRLFGRKTERSSEKRELPKLDGEGGA